MSMNTNNGGVTPTLVQAWGRASSTGTGTAPTETTAFTSSSASGVNTFYTTATLTTPSSAPWEAHGILQATAAGSTFSFQMFGTGASFAGTAIGTCTFF